MFQIFDFLAVPLGFILKLIYDFVGSNYLVAIFLFTLLMKVVLFPLSMYTQKGQADRARLAPRLERLQKKYADDRQKLQEKTQALYEKEGVKMTGGCLPMLLQMVLLFGIIATIYKPVTLLSDVPDNVVSTSIEAITYENYEKDADGNLVDAELLTGKIKKAELQGYYGELRLLSKLEANRDDIIARLVKDVEGVDTAKAEAYYAEMLTMSQSMKLGSVSLLDQPWQNGFAGINWLWLIPLISGITAFAASYITTRQTKKMQPQGEGAVPGQGCTTAMTMGMMPIFSLYISFIVPGGVGLYWIFSNLLGIVQTIILNKIYDPVKIRAQAEIDDEERRRQRREDKKRLAEIHRQENAQAAAEAAAAAEEARRQQKKKKIETTEVPAEEADAPAEGSDEGNNDNNDDNNNDEV